jgi:hypothetical protein
MEEVGAASAGETVTGGRRRERPAGHRHYSVAASARRDGAGFSASEWPGIGSEAVAVRRAEARRDPGRSTFPVTRAGSRAGPFRFIPWWPFGKCREQRMPRTPSHRHRPKVRDVVRRMTYFHVAVLAAERRARLRTTSRHRVRAQFDGLPAAGPAARPTARRQSASTGRITKIGPLPRPSDGVP